MNKLIELSTDFPQLSTKNRKLALTFLILMFSLLYLARTVRDIFYVWPTSDEIPFVWQSAFRDVAEYLDESGNTAVSLAGWSPETMDSPSMELLRQNDDILISHFNPQDGSLIIPKDNQIFRPASLPLNPFWETQLAMWDAEVIQHNLFTQYTTRSTPTSQFPMAVNFGDELLLRGYDLIDGQLVTYWKVTAVPASARQLFIHFLDEEGNLLSEGYYFDRQDPQGLWFPHWQAEDLILQYHVMPVGTQQVRLGWFDPYSCVTGTCQNLLTDDGSAFVLIDVESE